MLIEFTPQNQNDNYLRLLPLSSVPAYHALQISDQASPHKISETGQPHENSFSNATKKIF